MLSRTVRRTASGGFPTFREAIQKAAMRREPTSCVLIAALKLQVEHSRSNRLRSGGHSRCWLSLLSASFDP